MQDGLYFLFRCGQGVKGTDGSAMTESVDGTTVLVVVIKGSGEEKDVGQGRVWGRDGLSGEGAEFVGVEDSGSVVVRSEVVRGETVEEERGERARRGRGRGWWIGWRGREEGRECGKD